MLAVAGLLWPNRNRDQFGIDSRTVIGVTVASFLGVLLLFRDPVPYRYLLPVLPLVAASAASGVLRLHAVFRRRAFTSGLMAVLVLPSLADSVRMDSLLAAKDTRTLAGEWIGKHVPSNVAIVLLGGAECEPQILETPRSLARRIDYVKNLYGRASGTVVAELYQLQARDAVSRNRFGHEVYRNRVPQPLGEDLVLVVSPSYPLPMARYNPGWRTALGGEVAVEVKIRSITAGGSYEFDKSDAFFLPFTRLDEVERPGPNLRLELVRPLGSRLSAGP